MTKQEAFEAYEQAVKKHVKAADVSLAAQFEETKTREVKEAALTNLNLIIKGHKPR